MKLSILSLLGFLTTAAVGVVGSEINPLEPQIIADQVTNGNTNVNLMMNQTLNLNPNQDGCPSYIINERI